MLQRRSNVDPLICPMFNIDVEHLLHVFFDCAFASQIWQLMGVNLSMREVEDATLWLLEQPKYESYDKLVKVAMTLWGI